MSDPDLSPLTIAALDPRACADYLIQGHTPDQIASLTGVPIERVQMLAADPKTTFLVDKAKGKYKGKGGVFDVEKALADELEATFTKLTHLRDHAEKDETQLRAAVELFDRQRPKITKNETEMTVRITLSHEQQALATSLEAEVEALDVDFESYEPTAEQEKLA